MDGRLSFISGSMRGREVELEKGTLRIGRGTDMDLIVPEADAKFVSRLHATMRSDGDAWVIEDQGSTNGTFVNGARVTRRTLRHGDTIRFGKEVEARFSGDPDVTNQVPEDDLTYVASPQAEVRQPVARSVARPEPAVHARSVEKKRGGRAGIVVGVLALLLIAAGGVAWKSGLLQRNPDVIFPKIAAEYRGSVFLVETGVSIRGNYSALATGTAFAAGDGLLITNKHVIRPDLFSEDGACRNEVFRQAGLSFTDSLVITVWPGGSVFRQAADDWGDRGLGYSTGTGTLHVMDTGSDNLGSPVRIACDVYNEQFVLSWQPHNQDNADLAVLRIDAHPKPFPIAADGPATDAPVMAFGFPVGYTVLEGTTADPVWRGGRVIRTQETIQTDAVVQGGNSGGPLLNLHGEVVGVTTRGTKDSQFNMALKISYAKILLDRAKQ
jgi:FHA domain/Trypsin-like peptidase domain